MSSVPRQADLVTPAIERAAPLSWWRVPLRLSFRAWVGLSLVVHAALLGGLALWPSRAPMEQVTVYTVRVLDAPSGAAQSTTRASPAAKAEQRQAESARTTAAQVEAPDNKEAEPTWESEGFGTLVSEASPTVNTRSASDASPTERSPSLPSAPVASASASSSTLPAVNAESLDVGFTLLAPVDLGYPEAARRAHKSGQVRLEVEVGPDGRVVKVRVLESTPGWGFEESARNAYVQARFSPPRWQGRPVRVLWRKTLLFQP